MAGTPIRITASAVIATGPFVVNNVNVGVPATGQTLKLHNCTSVGAASSGNQLFTFALDDPQGSWNLDARFDVGVVAIISGGSPDVTLTVGDC